MEAAPVEQERRPRLARFLSRLVREQPLGTVGGIIVLLAAVVRHLRRCAGPLRDERDSPD